jgi:hypothetical protein
VERRNGARRKTRPEEDVQKRGIPAMLVLSGGCPVLGGSVGGSCPVSGGGTPICKTTGADDAAAADDEGLRSRVSHRRARMRSPSPAPTVDASRDPPTQARGS